MQTKYTCFRKGVGSFRLISVRRTVHIDPNVCFSPAILCHPHIRARIVVIFSRKVRHSHVGSSLIVFETYISELCFPQQSCQWMTRMGFAHNRRHCRVRLYRSSTGDCLIHTSGNNPLTDALLSKLILHRWPLQPCQGAWQLYPEISLLPRAKLILLAPCILFCLWLWF